METLSIIISLVSVVAGILQIVLFFKVWGMCNDIRAMRQGQAPIARQSAEENGNEGITKNNQTGGNNREAVGCAVLAAVFLVILIVAFILR